MATVVVRAVAAVLATHAVKDEDRDGGRAVAADEDKDGQDEDRDGDRVVATGGGSGGDAGDDPPASTTSAVAAVVATASTVG